jgi:ribosome-associated protein
MKSDANADLVVSSRWTIPGGELEWSFGPSGGPGGQHANRAHTRAELRFDVASTESAPEELRERVLANLGSRHPGGVATVSVDESRSQFRNRQIARKRMAELLATAARPPARARRATKPGRGARQRRLDEKRHRGDVKRLRRRPDGE